MLEEQAAEQGIARFQCRRFTRTHDAVDVDERIFTVAALVGCERVADVRADVDVVDREDAQRLEAELLDFLETLVVDFITGFEYNFAGLFVVNCAGEIGADQFFLGDQVLFQAFFFKLLRLACRNLGAGGDFYLAGFCIDEVMADLDAAETVSNVLGLPAILGLFVRDGLVEGVEDFLIGNALDFCRVDRLVCLDLTLAVFRGLIAVECEQQRGNRQLAAAVDTDIYEVLGVEFEVEP